MSVNVGEAGDGEVVDVTATHVIRATETTEVWDDTVTVDVSDRPQTYVRETYTEDFESHDDLHTIGYSAPHWEAVNNVLNGGDSEC